MPADNGVVWIRSGYCSDCGECCAGTWTPDDPAVTPTDPALAEVEGARPMCGAWTEDRGDGCSGCVLAALGRKPQICIDWPTDPSQIGEGTSKPSCTYTFSKG